MGILPSVSEPVACLSKWDLPKEDHWRVLFEQGFLGSCQVLRVRPARMKMPRHRIIVTPLEIEASSALSARCVTREPDIKVLEILAVEPVS